MVGQAQRDPRLYKSQRVLVHIPTLCVNCGNMIFLSLSSFSSSPSFGKISSMSSHHLIFNFWSWTKPLAMDNENTFFKHMQELSSIDLSLPKQASYEWIPLKDLSRNRLWYISFKLGKSTSFNDSRVGKAARGFWSDVASITYSTSSLLQTSRTFKHWKPSLSNSYAMFFKSFIFFFQL